MVQLRTTDIGSRSQKVAFAQAMIPFCTHDFIWLWCNIQYVSLGYTNRMSSRKMLINFVWEMVSCRKGNNHLWSFSSLHLTVAFASRLEFISKFSNCFFI